MRSRGRELLGEGRKRRTRPSKRRKNINWLQGTDLLAIAMRNVCTWWHGPAFLCYQKHPEYIKLVGNGVSSSGVSVCFPRLLLAVSSATVLTLHSDQVTFLLSRPLCPLTAAVLAVTSTIMCWRIITRFSECVWMVFFSAQIFCETGSSLGS